MNDLVWRQDAIDAIKYWGLIDGLSEGEAIEILEDEEKLPSAQPEIIRCKDCVYKPKEHQHCYMFNTYVVDDFFCGEGERRTDG